MEPHEAKAAYRAQIAKFFGELDPRPTDEWIAEQVDRLVPIEAGAATGDGTVASPSSSCTDH